MKVNTEPDDPNVPRRAPRSTHTEPVTPQLTVDVWPFALNHGRTLYSEVDALAATLWPPRRDAMAERRDG
jgi:hypothetical protein